VGHPGQLDILLLLLLSLIAMQLDDPNDSYFSNKRPENETPTVDSQSLNSSILRIHWQQIPSVGF
jgi:hypothetical protein